MSKSSTIDCTSTVYKSLLHLNLPKKKIPTIPYTYSIRNQIQQQPLSPQTPLPPVILSMQQLLAPGASSHHPRYSNPYDGPYQHQPPNSGPSRNRRKKGARKAETRYPYQIIHESSGQIMALPLASTRDIPGSMPTTTQESARYGEPRQRPL